MPLDRLALHEVMCTVQERLRHWRLGLALLIMSQQSSLRRALSCRTEMCYSCPVPEWSESPRMCPGNLKCDGTPRSGIRWVSPDDHLCKQVVGDGRDPFSLRRRDVMS